MLSKVVVAFLNSGRWILSGIAKTWQGIKKIAYWSLALLIPFLLLWFAIGYITDAWEFRDNDAYRGAASITKDPYDDPIPREKIRYLDQGWSKNQSLWFYSATQGSNLLPYDFFYALRQADSEEYFRDSANINRYRYLPQIESVSNPDSLPVGMSKDTYLDKEYVGFTCAACHTSQINYDGIGIRIDGGPAAADMENFIIALATALEATIDSRTNDRSKIEAFYSEVLARGNYESQKKIDQDLDYFAARIRAYTETNTPNWELETTDGETNQKVVTSGLVHYGFGRLDAFGRIYNRVLQYVISPQQLMRLLSEIYPKKVLRDASRDLSRIVDLHLEHNNRNDLLAKVQKTLIRHMAHIHPAEQKKLGAQLRERIFNPANAPVSIPYLWDIPHHDYVQWTGLVANAGLGPLGRNVGQVIGVFGTLDWQKKKGWTLNSLLAGQGFSKTYLDSEDPVNTYIDFQSSIDKRNLSRVEKRLRSLTSPEWPEDILPKIDGHKKEQGEKIFVEYCASCHANIDRTSPTRKIVTHLSGLDEVGTDPVLANNTANYRGYSGLLRDKYVDAGLGKLVMEERSAVASLVKFSTQNVVTEWDPDKNGIRRIAEWGYDVLKTLRDNAIKPTLKRGTYQPATTANPFLPLKAYKARALNGIWATAPYLHNGSVPSLYELLLPKRREGDPEFDEEGNTIEYRSDSFVVGSREFVPEVVGFRTRDYPGFRFDTSIPGNSNQGHEYAVGRTAMADGTKKKPLTKVERESLLEYLKSL